MKTERKAKTNQLVASYIYNYSILSPRQFRRRQLFLLTDVSKFLWLLHHLLPQLSIPEIEKGHFYLSQVYLILRSFTLDDDIQSPKFVIFLSLFAFDIYQYTGRIKLRFEDFTSIYSDLCLITFDTFANKICLNMLIENINSQYINIMKYIIQSNNYILQVQK